MTAQSQPIFRFAPSPNGRLHLGHAYSALFTDHWAKQLGGTCLLRIEDIDTTRSRSEYIDAIYEDLHWLGLQWPEPVMHQSHRFDAYKAATDKLLDTGLSYPCFCSRSDIAQKATGTDPDGAPIYPGTCRHIDPETAASRIAAGEPVQYRLDNVSATARTGMLTYSVANPTPNDRPQIRYADPARWGDVVIARKDTPTSYHLSVVVDDAAQKITHVTRGRDLEAATDIHVLLQFLLGLPAPTYTFHKLINDETGEKLSKSKGAPTLQSLREAGETPESIRTRLGF